VPHRTTCYFDHIDEFRQMILASDVTARGQRTLKKLLPFQRKDFAVYPRTGRNSQ